MMPDGRWSVAVHGGARTIPIDQQDANREGCRVAAAIAADILRAGGSALDAVEQAVRQLEDDRTFNAGSGSVPTAEGGIEMDSAIMDGGTLDIGAVAVLRRIKNPVSVARLLLTEPPVLLVGEGAQAFAVARGIPLEDVAASAGDAPQHDTVGCVAMDQNGGLASATSTGGLPGQLSGRVGDAPIPGCGYYADNMAGAVAISGDGESILRVLLASRVMQQLATETPFGAADSALFHLRYVGGEAGIIALNANGRIGVAHNSDHFAVAVAASWLPEPIAGICRNAFEGLLSHD